MPLLKYDLRYFSKRCQQSQLVLLTLTTIIGIAASSFLNATSKNCGKSIAASDSHDRIVGGTDAVPGEFPWMVSLRELDEFGFEHVCGAAILNENWIVTAAHCLDYPIARRYEVLVGLHKLSRERDSTVKKYKISKLVIHDKYDDDTFNNDIALLKTKEPIDISGSKGYINTICLPKNKDDPTGYATVIGWGHTRENGKNSDTLKKVLVPLIDRDLCKSAYDDDPYDNIDEVTETMICAGITGKDSCQNDSGGPLIQTDKNGVSTLIGVVSHGAGCGLKFYPGVYTKISMYQNWMSKVMY
ncbi:U21-ctenitoxin-Pn1a isoform X1 [Parasteatoda tepidariorum]